MACWPISEVVVSRATEAIVVLHWTLVRPHLKSYVQFWAPHDRKDTEVLEPVQRRTRELVMALEHKSDGEWLRELRCLAWRKASGEILSLSPTA